MRKFIYTVQDANGVHARPAGLLVKAAKALDSTITLENYGFSYTVVFG